MRINLHIQFEDGTEKDITANAADLVAFEDKYDISASKLGQDPKIGHLLFLAWHADHRSGGTEKEFKLWLEDVAQVGDSEQDPKSKG